MAALLVATSAAPVDLNPCPAAACSAALHTDADGYSCLSRIRWLMSPAGGALSSFDSCTRVGREHPTACGSCIEPLPPTASSAICGAAVNAGTQNCQPMLWEPTSTAGMACFAYGGPSDPCALTVTNDANSGLDKDPSSCVGDTFFLWDEPDTQGKSYAWAGSSWLAYSTRFSAQIRSLRARGVKVTTPLLRADHASTHLDSFWEACGAPCSDPNSPAFIDVIGVNPFCGSWNLPAGTEAGCRGGAAFVVAAIEPARRGKPIYVTNWGYLGSSTAAAQLPALDASDAFFAPGSPVHRVYWFGARDYGGGTSNNMLTDVVMTGPRAGRTLGQLWAEKCASMSAAGTTHSTPAAPSAASTAAPSAAPPQPASRCGVATCTASVLVADAAGHGCGARIDWLMSPAGGLLSEREACGRVGGEFPVACGGCSPA